MNIYKDIYVSKKEPLVVEIAEGTNGIDIELHVADWTIPTSATAQIYLEKPSGALIYNAASIEDNSIIISPTTQMTAEVGVNKGQLRIVNGTDILHTFIFYVKVYESIIDDSAIESQDEFTALEEALAAVSDVVTHTELKNKGSATQPIYFDANGVPQTIGALGSATQGIYVGAGGQLTLKNEDAVIYKGNSISIGGSASAILAWIQANYVADHWIYARVTPSSSGIFGLSSFSIMANMTSQNSGWGWLESDSSTNAGCVHFRVTGGTMSLTPLFETSSQLLTMNYTQNNYVTATDFNRMKAYKRNGMLFFYGNLLANGTGGTMNDFVTIGSISGWDAIYDAWQTPGNQSGTGSLSLTITPSGDIQIFHSGGITVGSGAWYRCSICVPSISM
jgi:hypothetical protein